MSATLGDVGRVRATTSPAAPAARPRSITDAERPVPLEFRGSSRRCTRRIEVLLRDDRAPVYVVPLHPGGRRRAAPRR